MGASAGRTGEGGFNKCGPFCPWPSAPGAAVAPGATVPDESSWTSCTPGDADILCKPCTEDANIFCKTGAEESARKPGAERRQPNGGTSTPEGQDNGGSGRVGSPSDSNASTSSSSMENRCDWWGHGSATLVVGVFTLVGTAAGSSAVMLYGAVLIIFLVFGEMLYSQFLAYMVFRLDDREVTPANSPHHAGKPDYVATPSYILLGHHWTSITGAAPIIGPAIASYYGWLPAILWVTFGSILIGSVHDFAVLVVSARNDARSIADLAGVIIGWRARLLFLTLIMFLCWIVIAVFMNSIANFFVTFPQTVLTINMEIPLAALMGVLCRLAQKRYEPALAKTLVMLLSLAALVFLYIFVFVGVEVEAAWGTWVEGVNVDPVFGWALHDGQGTNYSTTRQICRDAVNYKRDAAGHPTEATCPFGAMQFWTLCLTLYALIVSVIPVWVLLQPRDFINSHQLKACMLLLCVGLLAKRPVVDAESVRSDPADAATKDAPIFPMLFVTIACGAVSGFHGLVSSGITSKQLDRMPDARIIGYGGMLGESCLAALVIVVCCSSGEWATQYGSWPVNWSGAFVSSASSLIEELGVGKQSAQGLVVVLVVSFAATTLDSGMRIQRVLIEEFGRSVAGSIPAVGKPLQNIVVSGLLAAAPSCFLANSRMVGSLWNLFGATNQLVACLSLLTVTVYVLRYRGFSVGYALPFALPTLFLGIVISWALVRTITGYLSTDGPIDWFTTIPTYPSIILAFLIALSVFAVFAEVVWYFASGAIKRDSKVDPVSGRVGSNEVDSVLAKTALSGCC